MDVDFRPLGKHGCKMGVAFVPPRKMDAQLEVAFAQPQAKMSCVVGGLDDVCVLTQRKNNCLALQGRSRETPHFATTDTQSRKGNAVATFSLHSFSSSEC